MNWKTFWDEKATSENPFAQVARIGGNAEQNEEMLNNIVEHIVKSLDIKSDDIVLDMCCGNGLLTSRLAKYCKKIVGADLSEKLIEQASKNYPEITFVCADALNPIESSSFNFHAQHFTKVNLYFSFQYFSIFEKGKKVIDHLRKMLQQDSQIFLGDVPDSSKFFMYYNSPLRILQLVKQTVQDKNDMGKFWSEDELKVICKELNMVGKKLIQPDYLPYSDYRMDYIITVK